MLGAGDGARYYAHADSFRRSVRAQFDALFARFDMVLLPTAPGVAPRAEETFCAAEEYACDLYTTCANLAGLPAVSVPFGTDADGLPFGIQLMGARFSERPLLCAAHIVREAGRGRRFV